jgi:hypothetical protein
LDSRLGATRLCQHQEAQGARHRHAARRRQPPPACLVDEQHVGVAFECQHDGLAFAQVKPVAQERDGYDIGHGVYL